MASNKRINKAYVRYDGSGRVIPGSLILNRLKPKVGNWKETPSYLCCNSIPTPTEPALRLLFNDISVVNTWIGDSSNVADWNTFFDLPTNGNPFTSVFAFTNEIRLFGGSNINLKNSLFGNSGFELQLLEIVDDINCIISAAYDVFGDDNGYGCQNLTTVSLPSCTSAGDYCFAYNYSLVNINLPALTTAGLGCFSDSSTLSLLTTINLPNLITAGVNCFYSRKALTTINLPSSSIIESYCFFNCISLTTINLPVCQNLGPTVGNNSVFQFITGNNITLTIPSALMTCNSGLPDGDIQYLQTNNTVTIITT